MGYGNHAFTIIFIHEGAWKHAEAIVNNIYIRIVSSIPPIAYFADPV